MPPSSSGEFVFTVSSSLLPDQRQHYELIQQRMHQAAQAFEGYLGQDVDFVAADDQATLSVTTRVKFQGLEQCLRWLDSPQRRELLREAEDTVDYRYRFRLDAISFDRWIQAKTPSPPPLWKVNLLVWLALYPAVMVLSLLTASSLGRLPLALNMVISNLITVLLTGYWLVPWLSRVYGSWLNTASTRLSLAGTASIIALQSIMLALFLSAPTSP